MIDTALRRLRHALSARSDRQPRWAEHGMMFERALVLVQVFYVVTLFMLYERSRTFAALSGTVDDLDLVWPVFWLEYTGLSLGGSIIVHLCLGAGLLGIVAWRYFAVRALVSLAFLLTMSWSNSHGGYFHSDHEWFWISVCFLFLPNAAAAALRQSRAGRMQFLLGFGAAPALILLFYSLSGAYKIFFATRELVTGGFGGFHPAAMASTLAARAMETNSTPLWAEFVINNPMVGWPFYMSLYFVEIVAFAVFFRPALHRVWGVTLIMFHFGTLLFMDITFPLHVMINGLLFVMSPFAPARTSWLEMLAAVPLFGRVLRPTRSLRGRAGSAPAA